jgi:Zinc finger, C3HC4 type (RING finger)
MLAVRATQVGVLRLMIDHIYLRRPAEEVERIQTPCGKLYQMLEWTEGLIFAGHAFCRSCIAKWVENDPIRRCPSCRSRLPKHIAKVPSFETIQRGVGYLTSPDDKDATHR